QGHRPDRAAAASRSGRADRQLAHWRRAAHWRHSGAPSSPCPIVCSRPHYATKSPCCQALEPSWPASRALSRRVILLKLTACRALASFVGALRQAIMTINPMQNEKELAYRYDLFITPDWRDRFDTLVNENIELPTEGRILDVNSGTGEHAIELAERLGGK